jgi:hypothetical protein
MLAVKDSLSLPVRSDIRGPSLVQSKTAAPTMTYRAKEFLDYWESEHVEAVADSDKAKEAERLASACRQDAIRAGIGEQDLEDAVAGDLVGNMLQALRAVALCELEK